MFCGINKAAADDGRPLPNNIDLFVGNTTENSLLDLRDGNTMMHRRIHKNACVTFIMSRKASKNTCLSECIDIFLN